MSITYPGDSGEELTFTLWVPGGITKLRGIQKGKGTDVHHAEFARLASFALLGVNDPELSHVPRDAAWELMKKAVAELAPSLGHPELINAPHIGMGHSFSCGMITSIASYEPSRWVALSPGGLEVKPLNAAMNELPMMIWYGSIDTTQSVSMVQNLEEVRPAGALFGIAPEWGNGHSWSQATNLLQIWWQQAIARRYPANLSPEGGVPELVRIPQESGWLGERNDWIQVPDGRFKEMKPHTRANIAPYESATFDKTKAIWLLDAYTAHVWRGFTSPDSAVKMVTPNPQNSDSKAPVTLIEPNALLEVKLALNYPDGEIAKVEVFDGDKSLGEAAAPAYELNGVALRPGVHALMGVITRSNGQTLSSMPATVYALRTPCKQYPDSPFPVVCVKAL